MTFLLYICNFYSIRHFMSSILCLHQWENVASRIRLSWSLMTNYFLWNFRNSLQAFENTQNKWSHILKRWKCKHRPKALSRSSWKQKMCDFALDFLSTILQLYYIVEKIITVPSRMYETTAVKFHIT